MNTTNATLLAGRVLLAACFLPSVISRASNLSGFAASLASKGLPYTDLLAAAVMIVEIFGPVALILGLAPRLAGLSLIAATLLTTGILHRFWEMSGTIRMVEQAVFIANVGAVAGLLLYLVSGPGQWSWQSWWRREGAKPQKARKKSSKPRAPRAKPVPVRSPSADDELAEAA
jgi:putative oxidoreductase